jgi:hypothetical protein
MTALIDSGHVSRRNFPFNNFRTTDLRFTSQPFGPEPNALTELCNCLMLKRFGSPGRIRTSNISVNSLGVQNHKSLFSRRLGYFGSPIFSLKCSKVVLSGLG